MEKRVGSAILLVYDRTQSVAVNEILSRHADIVIARQGIPLPDRGFNVISIIFEGTTDQIGSLTGQLGRVRGSKVKSTVIK